MSLPPFSSHDQEPGASTEALVLTVQTGPAAGQTHRLQGHATFLVGSRPAGVQLSLPGDPYVSSTHFMVEVNPPLARLVDLRSKNGTFLNGTRVEEAELRHGDTIIAGTTGILVQLDPPGPDPSPGPARPPTEANTAPLLPGYVILREVARGGMGIVYQARRLADDQFVAVKTVLPAVAPRPDTFGRFQREMAILERLSHPNIVRFLDTGESSGLLCFIMEWVEGHSGAEAVKAGPLAPPRVVALGCQLLEALAHAHLQGFIHRDVKPGNVLLTSAGGKEALKLADFGLARTYQTSGLSGLTICGQPGGTLAFMPPEQALDFRSARPSADQYSAAATLYYLLTGQMVYGPSRPPAEMLARIITEEPLPLRQPPAGPPLPGQLGPVLRRALSRDPQMRYPDVLAFRDALARTL